MECKVKRFAVVTLLPIYIRFTWTLSVEWPTGGVLTPSHITLTHCTQNTCTKHASLSLASLLLLLIIIERIRSGWHKPKLRERDHLTNVTVKVNEQSD